MQVPTVTLLARVMLRCLALAFASALMTFGWPARAGAEPGEAERAQARSLANEAANAYARGDYAEADPLFARAYTLVPAPTIALLHARTLVKLGRWLEASAVYERGARTELPPKAPEPFRRAVSDAREEGDALRARQPRLQVTLAQPKTRHSARILLDGRALSRERFGVWLALDPKPHTLELERDGVIVARERIVLREGEARVRQLELPRETDAGRAQRIAGWTSLGAGGVGLAVGLGTGLAAIGAHSDAERACADRICEPGSSGADALQRFYDYRTVSTVAYAVGAVGLGLGAVLLLTAPDGRRLAVSPAAGGLSVAGEL